MQEQIPGTGARRRRPYSSGDADLDERLRALVEDLAAEDRDLAFEILATAARLARDPVSRLDRKLANSALKEMRYAFSVFSRYRRERKVTMFGSARVERGSPEYEVAREFARRIAARGWMVVTGAGPGVMEAGNLGAGADRSFGINIVLPFEAKPNVFITGDRKLINFKYFFTRKLMFVKEADAFVLLPGGWGTLDETFELLTLTQTGKSDLHPIVLLDTPGGTYWRAFERFVREDLAGRGFVDDEDLRLLRFVDDPEEAVREIETFYRVYHSQRYVGGRLVLRLNAMPPEDALRELSEEFAEMLSGPIVPVEASPAEVRDDDVPDLPRVALPFDRMHFGMLRRLVDRLNALPIPEESLRKAEPAPEKRLPGQESADVVPDPPSQ
ncbi:MAG: TIGR00730 family Rossman fold protein [Acidobacteria bacterium]|nr:TIGR00730 family Rossman fold protein [Acidobacteriota bacterium]